MLLALALDKHIENTKLFRKAFLNIEDAAVQYLKGTETLDFYIDKNVVKKGMEVSLAPLGWFCKTEADLEDMVNGVCNALGLDSVKALYAAKSVFYSMEDGMISTFKEKMSKIGITRFHPMEKVIDLLIEKRSLMAIEADLNESMELCEYALFAGAVSQMKFNDLPESYLEDAFESDKEKDVTNSFSEECFL